MDTGNTALVRERAPMPMGERGRIGARRRWGPQRILRLDQLEPEVRAVVVGLIESHERNKAAAGSEESATAKGVRRASVEPSE